MLDYAESECDTRGTARHVWYIGQRVVGLVKGGLDIMMTDRARLWGPVPWIARRFRVTVYLETQDTARCVYRQTGIDWQS